jgi:succinate-acetate transporter protein
VTTNATTGTRATGASTGATTSTASRHAMDGTVDPTWAERSRIVLTPVAAPSILGLFGFAAATFMVASNLAGWWGTAAAIAVLAPFCAMFGGLAQFLAGMWSYRARDGLATAMHGTWGAFWLAFGLLVLMAHVGLFPAAVLTGPAFGFWFIMLAVITLFGALASTAVNLGFFSVLSLLAAGSALLAAGFVGASHGVVVAGGWVLVASAAAALYTAGALMLSEASGGRVILPLGERNLRANIPGHVATYPVEYPAGMPGSRIGQ